MTDVNAAASRRDFNHGAYGPEPVCDYGERPPAEDNGVGRAIYWDILDIHDRINTIVERNRRERRAECARRATASDMVPEPVKGNPADEELSDAARLAIDIHRRVIARRRPPRSGSRRGPDV